MTNFEWDPDKAKLNIRKHRVSFEEAVTAILDAFSKTTLDPDRSLTENRFITFGVSARRRLLVVCHAQRGESIRIISARTTTKQEREILKNIKADPEDSLRSEYKRSDLGELVSSKYATTQVDFHQLTEALLTCIGEDEGVKFMHHSTGNRLANHKSGDWTYEIDNANQITLRYWMNEFGTVEEAISNPPVLMTPKDRTDLQDALLKGVMDLRTKVAEIEDRQ